MASNNKLWIYGLHVTITSSRFGFTSKKLVSSSKATATSKSDVIRKQIGSSQAGLPNPSKEAGKVTSKATYKVLAKTTTKSLSTSSHATGKAKTQQVASQLHAGSKDSVKRKSPAESNLKTSAVSKAASIYNTLIEDNSKLYCLFLQFTIPLFTKANLVLQEEAPKIHVLLDILQDLLHQLLVRFVKPNILLQSTLPDKCAYKSLENQRDDDDLVVGTKVREFLRNGQLSSAEKKEFFSHVRQYYVASCNYIVMKFPMQDKVLKHARVADPAKRVNMSYSSVVYFVKRFQLRDIDQDQLEIEFALYQVDNLDGMRLDDRADSVWTQISSLKNKSTDRQKYPNLSRVMLTILSLAHSNATDERIFSLVRKNATDFTPSLSTPTLSDFLTNKVMSQAMRKQCHQTTFSDDLLNKCKKATMASTCSTCDTSTQGRIQ